MGMGDVKLMLAVGTFIRWPLAYRTLAHVLLFGVVISVVYAVSTGNAKPVLRNMKQGFVQMVYRKPSSEKTPMTLHHMPYALAILVGVVLSILYRYDIFSLWQ